jgi:ATP-binding cassette subfamily C protein CydD
MAERLLSEAAEAHITAQRREIVAREASTLVASAQGGPGALAALASEKLEALRPYQMRYAPARLRSTVLPLVILAIAFWQSWAVGLVLLVAGPLIPVFMALVGWAAKEASARQMAEIGSLSDLLSDRLAALSDLRMIGAGEAVVEDFARASEGLRARTMAVLRIAFLSSTVLELFAALGVAMVAVWVGFSLLGVLSWGTWGAALTPFAGIYLLLLTPEYFQPLRDLAAAWHDKAAAEAVTEEMAAWRGEARARYLGYDTSAREASTEGALRLEGVTVRRGPRRIAVPDVRLEAGQSLALTGPSGAGKSSLLRVIAGLEQAEAGQLCLGETRLEEATAEAWRARIGWMPQAPHFLDGSLRYNITFGNALRPEILAQARAEAVIAALPRGDLTQLGERGAGLSGGEARRVTLARALHGGPAVLLADEPTADLDDATASEVTEGLLEFVAAGGILVVATHDAELAARMTMRVDLPGLSMEGTA